MMRIVLASQIDAVEALGDSSLLARHVRCRVFLAFQQKGVLGDERR